MPPLDSLRVFATCVRRGSFSGAAAELFLTPSAVSLRVRKLEEQIGIELFARHGPRLTVTEKGKLLAAKIEQALSTIRGALDQCTDSHPPLRVTCAPTFAARWLVPRLPAYYALPDSHAIVLDATEAVRPAHEFDIAIRSGLGRWNGFSLIELLPDQGTPMLSPAWLAEDVAMSVRRLLDLPLLADPRWSRWFELAGVPGAVPRFARTRFATYELEAVAAAKGVGVALLSPFLYADLLRQQALIAPFEVLVEGPYSYWALWSQDAPEPHFVQWLRRELADASGEMAIG